MEPAEDLTDSDQKSVYWMAETEPARRGAAAQAAFDTVFTEQRGWREKVLRFLRMYRNLEMIGFSGPAGVVTFQEMPLSLNVVRNMTNAVHSRVSKNRVKASMQCKGATWKGREQAKKLEAYGTGLAIKEGLYKKTNKMALLDAIVTGTGVLKTYRDRQGKKPRIERIFSPNLVVDFVEGADLTPAVYYEIKYISKFVLARRYPEHKAHILKMAPASAAGDVLYPMNDNDTSDRVQVVECLYIDPDDDRKGMFSLVAQGVELAGGEWKDGDPYSIIRWCTSNRGWYGMGLAEELQGIQMEINRLVRKIQNSFALLGNPYVLADRASAIARAHITDIPGTLINFNGKPPIINAPQTVHPEMFAHLDRLYQRAYEIAGISQLGAQGQKPAGIESGRAMLVYDDIQDSDRFATLHSEWSDLHVSVIEKGIRAAKGIRGYKVKVFGKESYDELDFSEDIGLGDDDWTIFPMSSSLLGDTPAGQIDQIERMMKMGLISDPTEMLEHVTDADVAAYIKRVTAPRRLVERMVGTMLEKGIYMSPEPHMNLALTLSIAQEMYLEAKLDDANFADYPHAKNLALVRDFMVATEDLVKKAASKPPTMGAGAAPMPGAAAPPPAAMAA